MTSETITAIIYNKETGEYVVKTRDSTTGKIAAYHTNHLNNQEKAFAGSCKHYHEDRWTAQWAN